MVAFVENVIQTKEIVNVVANTLIVDVSGTSSSWEVVCAGRERESVAGKRRIALIDPPGHRSHLNP